MPTAALLPNLACLAVGAVAACHLLRTGFAARGVVLLGLLFALVDAALLARYAFGEEGAACTVPLLAMQGVAVGSALVLLFAVWRRRWSPTARNRRELFAAAFAAWLRGDLPQAEAGFRRLLRADPWYVSARVGLANVRLRQGRWRQARRQYRLARALDLGGQFRDLLAGKLLELADLRRAGRLLRGPRPAAAGGVAIGREASPRAEAGGPG